MFTARPAYYPVWRKILRVASFRAWPVAAGIALALGSLGCQHQGPTVAPVTGKVLLNGKPLTQGNVVTHPSGGRGSNGVIQSDGSFRLSTYGKQDGAIVGIHKVGVLAFEGKVGSGPEAVGGKMIVPQRYINPETSQLTIEVTADGPNEPVIQLSSP
jgi:hypothetical protein